MKLLKNKFILKLLFLFNQREKRQLLVLLLMMLIGAGFEVLSIGLVMPLFKIIGNPDIVLENDILLWLYNAIGMKSTREFLILGASVLFLAYLFKNLYCAFLYYRQYRFVYDKYISLGRWLLNVYLHSPYTFHMQRNSAELLRNITGEVNSVCAVIITQSLIFCTEILIMVFIMTLLVVIAPVTTLLIIIILGGSILIFYSIVWKKLGKLGKAQQMHSGEMIKWINQGLGGIKETKIYERESFFVNAFSLNSMGYANAGCYARWIDRLPSLFLEFVAMGSLLLVITIMLFLNNNMKLLIPTLAMFAMAAFRLMPSVNRIVGAMNNFRYYKPSVEVVHNDLSLLDKGKKLASYIEAEIKEVSEIKFDNDIEVRNLSYQYSNSPVMALKDLSFKISKTESVAFVGHSGAGKTTLHNVMLGLLTPCQGTILLDGKDILGNISSWQRMIGYVPQEIYLIDDTIRKNIAFGLTEKEIDDQKLSSALKASQLEEFVSRLPKGVNTHIGEHGVRISGGERQRLGIARALYHNPEILIMDEATSSLDNETEKAVTQAVDKLSGEKTILLIAHRLSTVKNCKRLYFMKEGRIVDTGSYDELIQKNKDFRRMAEE